MRHFKSITILAAEAFLAAAAISACSNVNSGQSAAFRPEPIGRFRFNCYSLAPDAPGNSITQGLAIYGDHMFALRDSGSCLVFNIKEETFLKAFKLESYSPVNHANVAFFGAKKYAETDPFPLLYVSQARAVNNQLAAHPELDTLKQLLYVERILVDKNGIPCGSKLVQVVNFTTKNYNSHLWTADRNHPEKVYCYGNTIGNCQKGNDTEVFELDSSLLEPDDFIINISEDDCSSRFLCSKAFKGQERAPQVTILQGATVKDGMLILCTGVGTWDRPSEFYIMDMNERDKEGTPLRCWSFNVTSTMPYELEDIDFYGDQLYSQSYSSRKFTPVETINLRDLLMQP